MALPGSNKDNVLVLVNERNNVLVDVENGQEQEVDVERLPPTPTPTPTPTGVATNHPLQPELEEEHSANNNNRWSRCSARSLTAFIFIILAAVGVVVGVAWSAVSPASSKTTNVSKQVAVSAPPPAAPIDDYEKVTPDGFCRDKADVHYPFVYFWRGSPTVDDCAENCQCAQGIERVKLRGFAYNDVARDCSCYVDWLDDEDAKDEEAIEKLNVACGEANVANKGDDYYDGGGALKGSGKIKSSDGFPGITCYTSKSKAGKSTLYTKSPKSG